jgi:uncharacterized protein (TIGR01244 family)
MTKLIQLSPALAVAGALTPEDFVAAAQLGFKTIINNRPDGEEVGQLSHRQEAELASAVGVDYLFVPAAKHEVLDDHVLASFADALANCEGPILLHCRSGLRSTIMWAALSVEAGAPVEQILATAKAAGFDLEAVRGEIADRAPSAGAAPGVAERVAA